MNQKTPRPVDVQVGSNILNVRKIRGLTQENLAEALGITFQQIQKYEKGTNRVSASRLVEIAAALECTIADLFAGVAVDSAAPAIPSLSPRAVAVAHLFDRIENTRQKSAVLDLIKAVAPEAA